jgi:hypothetical protein
MNVNAKVVSALQRAEGAYKIAAVSGLLTGVAAGTASAGHLFAFRWAPASSLPKFAVISRLRARLFTIAGFTAAQEFGMDLSVLRSYSAAHTGGTGQTLTGDNAKKRQVFPTTAANDIRIGTTGALTAGTHTFDAQPIAQSAYAELAAAATVAKGVQELYVSTEDLDRYPLVLAANEGLCIRNTVAMGAGGTARLVVELDWLETSRYG